MQKGVDFLRMKHLETVTLMHSGMKYCKHHFFPYPYDDMESWTEEYVDIKVANGSRLVYF